MRSKGKIATWNDDKGYGFIAPYDDGPQVFIHIKAFGNRDRRPEVGDVITYGAGKDEQGRARATSATLAGDKLKQRAERNSSATAISIALIFLAAVGTSVITTGQPVFIFFAYLAASLITFIAYAIDKSAAQMGRWRTGEGTLHLFALLGGWPGALIAQQTLRHKTKKTSFRVAFWLTVIMNCSALAWLHTADGRANLDRLVTTNNDFTTLVSNDSAF